MPGQNGARTLSRDFKDVRRHTHVAIGQTFNGWVGLGVGLALGLSVALGVHLYDRRQFTAATPEPVPAAMPPPASEVATDESAVPAQENAGPQLDFYDVLPKQEVEVPDKSKSAAAAGAKTPLPTGNIVLQAGSFKQSTEAEKMQAQLALLGISSRIQRASVEDETWYRVRIGPIATAEELHVIQLKLREAEISASPVSQADEVPLP